MPTPSISDPVNPDDAVNYYLEIVKDRLADVFADGLITPSDALYVSLGILELAGRVLHDLMEHDDEEREALSRFNGGFVMGTLTHSLGSEEGDSSHSGGTP